MLSRNDRADRIRGALWGLLVADAMGVPHEFKAPVHDQVAMIMPPSYAKTWKNTPYGTWSDDGSLTLALASSLIETGGMDLDDFGRRVLSWYLKGGFTPDGKMFDIGNTTQTACLKLVRGYSASTSGLTAETSNGNGSLMRTLPVGMYFDGDDEGVFQVAQLFSAVTHAHDTSTMACGAYSVAVKAILEGDTPIRACVRGLKACPTQLQIPTEPGGSGYVLDSLSFAIKALRKNWSYEQTVLEAIRLGGDTDTQAAIAGGLTGLIHGMDGIPKEWLRDLRGKGVAEPIIEGFVAFAT